MNHEERWNQNYEEILRFVEENKRRPSKYVPEERAMHNWLKYNRKLLNHDLTPSDRQQRLAKLEELLQHYRRTNQYQYQCEKLPFND